MRVGADSSPAVGASPLAVHRYHRRLWQPSQMGFDLFAMQPQNQAVLVASALNTTGRIPLPEGAPSQNGWRRLRPQAHQAYLRPATKATH